MDHVSDSFLETNVPLLVLIEAAKNGNEKEVKEYAQVFREHANKLIEVLYCFVFFLFFFPFLSLSLSPVHLQSEPDPPPDHNTQMLQLYPISIAYLIFIVVSVLWDKTCDKTIALLSLLKGFFKGLWSIQSDVGHTLAHKH